MKVKLSDLAQAMAQSDVRQSYVDISQGRVIMVEDELGEEETLSHIFDIEDDWENFIPIPNVLDDGKRELMLAFARTMQPATCERLESALQGHGGEARFLRTVHRLFLQPRWDRYFFEHLVTVAQDFCEENNIEYED